MTPAAKPAHLRPPKRGRFHSHLGSPIEIHRALRHKQWSWRLVAQMLVLPTMCTAALIWLWPLIAQFWHTQFIFWLDKLELPLQVALRQSNFAWLGDIPSPHVIAGLPQLEDWLGGCTFAVSITVASFFLPERFFPLRYALRLIAFIQSSAQIFFYFYAADYPYTSVQYLSEMLELSAVLMFVLPWLLSLIYLVIVPSTTCYLALCLLSVTYLSIFTPVQYLFHAVVLLHGSLLYHPLLYLLGAFLVQMMGAVALYAWALTWRHPTFQPAQ